MNEKPTHTVSSGNVFADLDFADPEAELVKAELAHQISRIIDERGWTQAHAGQMLRLDQPKVSKLVRGYLGEFSIDRLLRLLARLDQDVEITVRPRAELRCSPRVAIRAEDEPLVASGS